MKANGSPMPDFITDKERSFFQMNVPIHPCFLEEIEKREISPQIPPPNPEMNPTQYPTQSVYQRSKRKSYS